MQVRRKHKRGGHGGEEFIEPVPQKYLENPKKLKKLEKIQKLKKLKLLKLFN